MHVRGLRAGRAACLEHGRRRGGSAVWPGLRGNCLVGADGTHKHPRGACLAALCRAGGGRGIVGSPVLAMAAPKSHSGGLRRARVGRHGRGRSDARDIRRASEGQDSRRSPRWRARARELARGRRRSGAGSHDPVLGGAKAVAVRRGLGTPRRACLHRRERNAVADRGRSLADRSARNAVRMARGDPRPHALYPGAGG